MMHTENEIEKRIYDAVKKSDGMTIEDVSQELNVHRVTASKYLAVLEAKDALFHRDIGKAKLFSAKKG